MFDPISKTFMLNSPILWIDFAITLLFLAFLCFMISRTFKSKPAIISEIVLFIVLALSWFFGFKFLWTVSVSILTAVIVIFFIQNPTEIKTIIPGLFSKRNKLIIEKIYDREELVDSVSKAVEILSNTKTGALITFERKDKFDQIITSGTELHSPVIPELLTTIFFPGTRLHDGAVVIRRDEVLAASVYYRPTTKPLTGKYGSRHRAAIGISEITDSVTVVVSEETGRISIAQNGELQIVAQDQFKETLLEILMSEDESYGK